MPAPTLAQKATPAAPAAGPAKAPAPLVPFTRASRKMSKLIGTYSYTLNANSQVLPPIQVPASGFMRFLRLTVTGTTAGNAAATAFQADAPWNLFTNIMLQTASGDALTSPLTGFQLYVINRWLAVGRGYGLTVEDPAFSLTTGSGATGGSFKFQIRLPFEIDPRDAFGALENMAANQSYLLNFSLASAGTLYSTQPTTLPNITVQVAMEYWAQPAQTTPSGVQQQYEPTGNGTVSLLQTMQPSITASTQQSLQIPNVGNTIRSLAFILRNSSGVRTDADWPTIATLYQNGQPLMVKSKDNWNTQMAQDYRVTGGKAATPTANALDNGVFIVTDFMNDGASGAELVQASANRDLLLVTGSGTALNIESTSNWGANAYSLEIIEHAIRPSSPQALYAPFLI